MSSPPDSAPRPAVPHRRARRFGAAALTTVVALGGVVLLILFFQGRDDAELDRAQSGGPGQPLAADGGPLVRAGAVRADGVRLDGDALVATLELGNVVLLYGSKRPPAALSALAQRLAGPFDPALVNGGQAVVLARQAGTRGVVALAWRRVLRAADAADPGLETFAAHWLGRGAP